MERRGVSVDLEKLKSMEHVLVTKLKEVERECHKAAGRSFQVAISFTENFKKHGVQVS